MLELSEQVDVWVLFRGAKELRSFSKNKIQPSVFFWKGRQIKIDKINLVHTSKNGANIFHHFSVSSSGNFYKLRFDRESLNWMLEAVDEGD